MDKWLANIRTQLDSLDDELITLLAKRFSIIRKVGHYKKAHNIPMMQPKRITDMIALSKQRAQSRGLDPDFIAQLLRTIIDASCRMEDEIIG